MTDMLVKLYELPPFSAADYESESGVVIRRALAPEKHIILDWIEKHFGLFWRSECEVSFAHQPIGCFIATKGEGLIGFACYDVTAKGFFGPTGVSEAARGRGAGKALLLACLHALWAEGYVYGIIGGVGPVEFYEKVAGATVISDSTPAIYKGLLRG